MSGRDAIHGEITKPTETVNAFSLVGTNDDPTESCAVLEQENRIRVTTFCLTFTSTRTAIVAGVSLGGGECRAGGNGDGLAEGRSGGGRRERAGRRTTDVAGAKVS